MLSTAQVLPDYDALPGAVKCAPGRRGRPATWSYYCWGPGCAGVEGGFISEDEAEAGLEAHRAGGHVLVNADGF